MSGKSPRHQDNTKSSDSGSITGEAEGYQVVEHDASGRLRAGWRDAERNKDSGALSLPGTGPEHRRLKPVLFDNLETPAASPPGPALAKIIDEPRQSASEPESSLRNTPKTIVIARFFPAR